jgi:hypothetical protein
MHLIARENQHLAAFVDCLTELVTDSGQEFIAAKDV